MALLQSCLLPPSSSCSLCVTSSHTQPQLLCSLKNPSSQNGINVKVRSKKLRGSQVLLVRSSMQEVAVEVGRVTEVSKDTFWPLVKAAGSRVVVLDMYTQWCGPCKVIAPKYQELSEKYLDVVFLKLDCNQENKPLAKELGLRVVPTFKILKDNEVVMEVTGAKFDKLLAAIDEAKSST